MRHDPSPLLLAFRFAYPGRGLPGCVFTRSSPCPAVCARRAAADTLAGDAGFVHHLSRPVAAARRVAVGFPGDSACHAVGSGRVGELRAAASSIVHPNCSRQIFDVAGRARLDRPMHCGTMGSDEMSNRGDLLLHRPTHDTDAGGDTCATSKGQQRGTRALETTLRSWGSGQNTR